jgi:hypothetical protein
MLWSSRSTSVCILFSLQLADELMTFALFRNVEELRMGL